MMQEEGSKGRFVSLWLCDPETGQPIFSLGVALKAGIALNNPQLPLNEMAREHGKSQERGTAPFGE